jgi:hypothetical protein
MSAELLLDNSAWARLDQEQGRIATWLPLLLEADAEANPKPI